MSYSPGLTLNVGALDGPKLEGALASKPVLGCSPRH